MSKTRTPRTDATPPEPSPEPRPDPRWMARSVRLPENVWRWLDELAERNRRSANQQLLWMLEQQMQVQQDGTRPS